MSDLTLHGRPVETVFDLLGQKEDDITYSLGWGLARSEQLASRLLGEVFPEHSAPTVIRLQESVPAAGRTDIEIETEREHLIIEAKRGWTLPTATQLELYAPRFEKGRAAALLVVAEATPEWARPRLPTTAAGIAVSYLPWSAVLQLVDEVSAGRGRRQAERRLLRELHRYLRSLTTMQDPRSNLVYVVSLKRELLPGSSGLSTIDVLVDHDRYYCPVGGGRGGWPKTPPNYLGFRFRGQLQQVRHVEGYEIEDAPWQSIPVLAGRVEEPEYPRFLFEFGPVIKPLQEVRTGNLFRGQRVWAALDLLLTSATIADARDRTRQRHEEAGIPYP